MITVLASGNGSNLQALIDAKLPVGLVIVNNAGAKALDRARAAGIEVLLIEHEGFPSRDRFDAALVEAIEARGADWIALAGFMRIVGPRMLEAFPRRIVNIHPALLPAFPGLHAQRQAIEAGVKIAGCTVHLVDAGVDTGPILAQAALHVLPDDDEKSLSARILRLEHSLYPAVLRALLDGRLAVDGRRARIDGALDVAAPAGRLGALISPR